MGCRGFPGGSDGKESAYNMGNIGSISGYRRSPGEGNGNPFQYSYLENSMDRGSLGSWNHKELNMTELLRHTHVESKKNGVDELICREGMETQMWKMDLWIMEEGESGMKGESSINIYTLSCVKQKTGEKSLYNTGSSAWCSMMT